MTDDTPTYPDVDDKSELDTLVAQACTGDHESFETLMRACYSEVRGFCSARVISVDMLDEAVQSTFIRCYENLQRYHGEGTFLSWIKGIAKNICFELIRERRRHVAVEEDVLEQVLLQYQLQEADDADQDLHLRGQYLDTCIGELAPKAKQLIKARYLHQVKVRDIAKELGKNANWVSVNLHRVRDLLRQCLEKRAAT